MRKIVSLLSVLMLLSALAFGQTRTIAGTVSDEKGDALPGASVRLKGTRSGVAADNLGQFRILAKTGDVLVVSGAGIETTEATVGAGNTITIAVTRTVVTGTEVVVTALGQTRQPKELGYSIAKIKASELTQAKTVNLQNGLTGKVSGLNVQTVNNGVFADTRLTLRGIRSLTGNNQPMLIVDGVPISLGYLSSINPNDIVDVVILKGASATAIYGPEGVNGALVVTLRRGTRAKPNVSVGHTVQIEKVSFMPKLQDQFGSGSAVDAFGYGVYTPYENQCYGDAFDGSLRQIGRDGPGGIQQMVPYSALPNEKKKFWNTGITNQTDVSFTTNDFYMSAQNVNIQGIMPKDVNRRVSIHMAANKEYNKFKASYSLNYTKGNYDVNVGSSFGNGRDYTVYWNLINTPMEIPITQYKNWRGLTNSDGSINWANPNYYFNDYYSNPYFMVDNFRSVGRSEDVFGNAELNFKATNWLNFTYRLGATITNASAKSTGGDWTYSPFAKASGKSIASTGDLLSQVVDGSSASSRINSEFFATINKTFGDFKVDALVGQSFRENNSKNISVSSNTLGIAGLYNIIGRKGEPGAGESDFKNRLERYFGKVGINYKNWAFAEATASYDIDSRLANYYDYQSDNTNFFYPGVNLSFLLSEAIPAIKGSKVISYLKVRGALSKTGNVNLGTYSLENTYGPGGGFPYGNLLGFTSSNTLRQSSYKPEFVQNKEVGFEIGFLRNRINLEATYYKQENTNQIVSVQYSGATGFTSALLNAASFSNTGLELDLRLSPLVKINDVSINFKGNFTYQANRVYKIIEGVDELGIGNGNYVIVGQPAYTFKLTDYTRDDQGRVIVDAKTGLPTVDPTIKNFGQTAPKYMVGLNLNVTWKELSFNAVADYRTGNQIYTGNLGTGMDFSGVSKRSGQNARQPFIMPNSSYFDGSKYVDNTSVYTISGGYNFWSQGATNTNANSNYIVDGSFWKLREVSISYNLPTKWFGFSKNAIKGVNVAITGRNLLMILPKSNEWTDPEFANTTGNALGVSGLDNYPPTRIIGGSLTIQL